MPRLQSAVFSECLPSAATLGHGRSSIYPQTVCRPNVHGMSPSRLSPISIDLCWRSLGGACTEVRTHFFLPSLWSIASDKIVIICTLSISELYTQLSYVSTAFKWQISRIKLTTLLLQKTYYYSRPNMDVNSRNSFGWRVPIAALHTCIEWRQIELFEVRKIQHVNEHSWRAVQRRTSIHTYRGYTHA